MRRLLSLLTLLLLIAPVTALAAAKAHSHSFTLADSAQLGNMKLKPGDYRLEWTRTGNSVPVTLIKDGKVVAQLHAKVVDQKSVYDAAAVDMTKQADGSEMLRQVVLPKVSVMFNSAGGM